MRIEGLLGVMRGICVCVCGGGAAEGEFEGREEGCILSFSSLCPRLPPCHSRHWVLACYDEAGGGHHNLQNPPLDKYRIVSCDPLTHSVTHRTPASPQRSIQRSAAEHSKQHSTSSSRAQHRAGQSRRAAPVHTPSRAHADIHPTHIIPHRRSYSHVQILAAGGGHPTTGQPAGRAHHMISKVCTLTHSSPRVGPMPALIYSNLNSKPLCASSISK